VISRLVSLAIGYLFGSILVSDLVARLLAHKSAFELGDGNPGMANVGHELGTPAALLSLVGDIAKCALAILIANLLFPALGKAATAWAGLGAILGHDFPFWHRFRGGKGVTCVSTTMILISPVWGLLAGLTGTICIIFSGYLSVGALCGMGFYCVAMLITESTEIFLVSCVFFVLQVYAHFSKLKGIAQGTTRKASLSVKLRSRLGRK